jgi:hypothetical protein
VPDVEAVLTAGTLEYYKEGAAATVTVRRAAGARMLAAWRRSAPGCVESNVNCERESLAKSQSSHEEHEGA